MAAGTISRRNFLKIAGLGAGVAACGGLTALATYSPTTVLPVSTYGDQVKAPKILVAYASKCGSTGEVAAAIGRTLAQNGVRVDVSPIKQIVDLAGYQAVFIGSAIRVAKWLPEASNFVREQRASLERVPLAYFTVCMTLSEDTPANRAKAAGFIEPVRSMLAPAAEGFFAGRVDPQRLSIIESTMLRMKSVPEGDFRDWGKISVWAQSAYEQILVG
jgi:menaquinone-dependent protoporphyrinogen oxidase